MIGPLFPVFAAAGLLLPGYFLARYFRESLRFAAAFLLSLPILFQCVFWTGVCHVPLELWTVLPCLPAVTGAAAARSRDKVRSRLPGEREYVVSSGRVSLLRGVTGAVASPYYAALPERSHPVLRLQEIMYLLAPNER